MGTRSCFANGIKIFQKYPVQCEEQPIILNIEGCKCNFVLISVTISLPK